MRSTHLQRSLAMRGVQAAALARRLALAGACTAALLLGAVSGAASATTYNVTRTDDPVMPAVCSTPAGGCSLRQALTAIDSAPSPPDVVNLVPGIYTNDQQKEFVIVHEVSIVGPGSASTLIEGSASSRALRIDIDPVATVSISGVTIAGGHSAGSGAGVDAVLVGTLNLDHVAILDNTTGTSAGGLFVQPGVMFTLRDSLVADNTAGSGGGGIVISGPAQIVDSTIAGNSAPSGGGVLTGASTLIASSTIARNSATFASGVGGDVYAEASAVVTLRNSIVSDGTGPPGKENCYHDPQATFASAGSNIEDRNQCGLTATGDQPSTPPQLGVLPGSLDASSTLPLLPGSPAINAGNPTGCRDPGGTLIATDQRGVARPQGAACDIGAFEFQAPSLTGAPAVTGSPRVGTQLTCAKPQVSSPDGAVTDSFAWLRNGADIAGATAASYTAVAGDSGQQLSCRYTATNSAVAVSATSVQVAIHSPPTLTGVPSIAGTPNPGQRLACNPPALIWSPDPTTTAYAWLRDGTPISGATGATYTIAIADRGHIVACQFTTSNVAGSTSATSQGLAISPSTTHRPPSLKLGSKMVTIDPNAGNGTVSAACSAPAGDVCAFSGALFGSGKLPAGVASGKPKPTRARKLGTLKGTIAAGQTGKLTIGLTSAGWNLVEDHAPVRARIRGATTDHLGDHTALDANLRLKPRRGNFPPGI